MASEGSIQTPSVADDDLAQPSAQSESTYEGLPPDATASLNASQTAPVAVDDAFSEVDEGYAQSMSGSDLTSIASNIRKGVLENGRVYPNFGKNECGLPMDDAELERNDIQHAKLTRLLGGLHLSPIGDEPQNILDLGAGTGVWAIDMADAYPSANVTGIDIAATQPSWVPPNCQFEIDDMEDDWERGANTYDLIHCRELILAIRDWDKVLRQSFEHLKPGGWLELGCTVPQPGSDDGTMERGAAYLEIGVHFLEMSRRMGTSILAPYSWKSKMQAIGFTKITETPFKVPLGPWPKDKTLKEVGKIELVHVPEALEPCVLRGFTSVLGGDYNELQILLARARKELRDPKMHSYVRFVSVYGQKPETPSFDNQARQRSDDEPVIVLAAQL